MSYPYRCTKACCRKRRALHKRVEQYVREPKCRACGGRLSLDEYKRKENKSQTCRCDGYHFPHRKGSKFCNYYTGVLTEEDLKFRFYRA